MLLERFIGLRQWEKTVSDYINPFNELTRFGFELINITEKKVKRFAKGLNSPFKETAMGQLPFGAT